MWKQNGNDEVITQLQAKTQKVRFEVSPHTVQYDKYDVDSLTLL